MAAAKRALSVLVIGGAGGAGLAAVKALLRRGHQVTATACDADGALAIRQAGALPVYPDLDRASELLSVMQLAKADAIVQAGPQFWGGAPQAKDQLASPGDALLAISDAVARAAAQHGVGRIISLSFGWLYEGGHGPAKEGSHDTHDSRYAPMLAAEAAIAKCGAPGVILRCGYIYGGHSGATRALADMIKARKRLPSGGKAASWIHEDDLASAIVSLLEADSGDSGEILNAAAGNPRSPDDFAAACAEALGLNRPAFASPGPLGMLRQESFGESLLARELVIDSSALSQRFAWQPRHTSIESGLEASALVWRMRDAVEPDDFYNDYDDQAAAAIEDFAYPPALPEVAVEAESPEPAAAAAAPTPAAPASPPPPSAGPTPWNEDDAKREERRRRALERKAKRAAKQAGG